MVFFVLTRDGWEEIESLLRGSEASVWVNADVLTATEAASFRQSGGNLTTFSNPVYPEDRESLLWSMAVIREHHRGERVWVESSLARLPELTEIPSAPAAFDDLNWLRIDLHALVPDHGLLSIDEPRREGCREWLIRHGYKVDSFDCRHGVAPLITEFGRFFRWEEMFGYPLGAENRNLDALRDGFEFDIPEGGGRVFELLRPDVAWEEDSVWLSGLLAIASERSAEELAIGRRFFALLVMPEDSPLIGTLVEEIRVPGICWRERDFTR